MSQGNVGKRSEAAVETAHRAHGAGSVCRRVLRRLARAWSAFTDRVLGKLWSLMD